MSMHRRRRNKKRKINWPRLLSFIALLLVGTCLVFLTAGYIYLKTFQNSDASFMDEKRYVEEADASKYKDQYVFLVMGTDINLDHGKVVQGHTRSDTMILVFVNTKTNKFSTIAIPRDSRVFIPGRPGKDKINHAHAYGGAELSIQTVEDFFQLDIDHYVEISYEGFRELIDIIGGVPINVEKNMYYRDPTQDLVINLKKGEQVLKGYDAMGYVRFRHDPLGDIGRVQRQAIFMQALYKELLSPETIVKLPEIARKLPNFIATDMSPGDIIYFASQAPKFTKSEMQTWMVDGTAEYIDDLSYWIPDENMAQTVAGQMLEGSYVPVEELQKETAPLNVEVLNGNGKQGIVAKFVAKLPAKGLKVVYTGNADSFSIEKSSIVVYDKDRVVKAEALLTYLPMVKKVSVSSQTRQGVDATIVLGQDYKE